MKKIELRIVFLLSLAFFITSCIGNESHINKDQIFLSGKNKQTFDVDLSEEFILVGEKGTIITIPKNCFGTKFQKVKIELKECYNIQSMLFNRLSTSTVDKRSLETEGMIFIKVLSENGRRLRLKNNKITLQMPTKAIKKAINCFYGVNEKYVKWSLSDENIFYSNQEVLKPDTTMTTPGIPIDFSLEEEEEKETKEIIVLNPSAEIPSNIIVNNYDSLKKKNNVIISKNINNKNLVSYIFQISHLGWINLDKYIEGEMVDVVVDLKNVNEKNVEYSLVLENYNSVVVGEIKSESSIIFKNVSKNEPFTIVALFVNHEEIKFEMLDGNSSNNSLAFPSLKPIERDDLTNKLLKKFGKDIWNRPLA